MIRVNALVKFENVEGRPFENGTVFVYLGDIVQMPGHAILIRTSDGRVFTGFHTEELIELRDEET